MVVGYLIPSIWKYRLGNQLEKGTNVRAEDIKEMLKTRVARFKIPEYIVFVEDIPKTHNGKIDKRMIKEWMRNIMEGSPKFPV